MKTFDDYIKSIKNLSDLTPSESEDSFDQILTCPLLRKIYPFRVFTICARKIGMAVELSS